MQAALEDILPTQRAGIGILALCVLDSPVTAIHLGNAFHFFRVRKAVVVRDVGFWRLSGAGQSPSPAAFRLGDPGDAAGFNLAQAHFPYLISGANNNNNNAYVISLLSLLRRLNKLYKRT